MREKSKKRERQREGAPLLRNPCQKINITHEAYDAGTIISFVAQREKQKDPENLSSRTG